MKRKSKIAILVVLMITLSTMLAFAAGSYYAAATASNVPRIIPYEGHLDKNGVPENGTYSFTFRFYNAESDGDALSKIYSPPDIKVTNGSFRADIGPVVEEDVFEAPAVYLEISVNGNILAPRQKINSVPFAVKASRADYMGWNNVQKIPVARTADNTLYAQKMEAKYVVATGPSAEDYGSLNLVIGTNAVDLFVAAGSGTCTSICIARESNSVCLAAWNGNHNKYTCDESAGLICLCANHPK